MKDQNVEAIQRCDVAIVGGGPVGMLLAGELALHGVDVVVLETRTEVSDQPKAGTYHARAIHTLARRGILRFPLDETDHRKIVREPFQFAGFPWLTLRSPAVEGPVMIGLAQADLERALGERAVSLGARVLRAHEVVSLHQDSDAVELVIRSESGDEQWLFAEFAVGCDGARSVVRESGQFRATEYPPTLRAVLGMARLPYPEQLEPGWQRTERGWTLLNLNRFGSSRIITFEFDGPEADRRRPITAVEFSATVDRIAGKHVELENLEHTSRFSDYSRIVENYRDGRMFVAGDAAHVHYPLGGQGLNTGLQDAVNLGWKLVSVIKQHADPAMLDSYSVERQPVAAQVIDNTRVQAMLMNPKIEHDPLRAFISDLLTQPAAHDRVADAINGNSVVYPNVGEGPLEGSFFPNITLSTPAGPHSVAELLVAGGGLLIVAADEAGAIGSLYEGVQRSLVDVVLVEDLPQDIPPVVLVRPDGYVAWSGSLRATSKLRPADRVDGPASLAAAIAHWFGVASVVERRVPATESA